MSVARTFVAALSPVYQAYISAQRALAADDHAKARQALTTLAASADAVAMRHITGEAHGHWMRLRRTIADHASRGAKATDIKQTRMAFDDVSRAMIEVAKTFGQATGAPLYESFCPMAFDNRGASWLADSKEIKNPWFGAAMLRCGEVRSTFLPVTVRTIPEAFRARVSVVAARYLELTEELSKDDFGKAQAAMPALDAAFAGIQTTALDRAARSAWRKLASGPRRAIEAMGKARDIEALRRPFALLSDHMIRLLKRFGHAGPDDLAVAHCPMAFNNRGADWIQRGDEIRNPYFGAAMYRCGSVTARLPREGGE